MGLRFEQLGSIGEAYHRLASLLESAAPPSSIYVHSPSNTELSLELIQSLLQARAQHPRWEAPANDEALVGNRLPRLARIDLVEIANSAGLFDRILNQLAGWNPPWDPQHKSLPSWNGYTEGLRFDRHSNRLEWAYDQSHSQDDLKGLLGQRKSKSLDGFCDGLRILTHQLRCRILDDDRNQDESSHAGRSIKIDSAKFPKFILLHEPERLRHWKDGPQLITCLTRLMDFAGCPVHTIFVSRLPWSKLRPRYGALEPMNVAIPKLSEHDLAEILSSEGPPPESVNDHPLLAEPSMQAIFRPFISFIVTTFESLTSSDLYELSALANRLWPGWLERMREGGCSVHDTARLILLSRPTIELELQNYGRPVWHLPQHLSDAPTTMQASQQLTAEPHADQGDLSTVPDRKSNNFVPDNEPNSPSKSTSQDQQLSPVKTCGANPLFTTPSKSRHYLSLFSPLPSANLLSPQRHSHFLNLMTPFKNLNHNHLPPGGSGIGRGGPAGLPLSRQKCKEDSLSISLPVVSKFILISSYLASYNPVKSDLRLFLTNEDSLYRKKTKRVRGNRKPQPGQEVKKHTRQELLGPKAFSIERMFYILYAILDQEGYANFCQIDSIQQVGTLLQSRLLIQSNHQEYSYHHHETIKLVCNLTFNQVSAISQSLNFDLQSRIWEVDDY